MAFRRRKRIEEGINPTALVDVFFNLLIFVVITAQYSNLQSIKVNLPKAQTGEAMEKMENIVITLTRDEKIFFNNQPVSLNEIKSRLAPFAKRKDPPRIVLEADEGSKTGQLVTVMDMAQQVGLKKISIETRK